MQLHRRSAALVCAFLISASACDDSSTEPTPSSVAGTYFATQFTTTTGTTTTNQLAAGASVTLVLDPSGSTSGRLFVPGSASSGIDAPLTGSWSILNGRDVGLTSTVDTFMRDMLFTVSGNTLVGDQTFGSTRIRIVLTKQ